MTNSLQGCRSTKLEPSTTKYHPSKWSARAYQKEVMLQGKCEPLEADVYGAEKFRK
ncbi:MAG: hypothetical protein NWF02_00855 [Candidatus Bathyarchaeota archaeon]|nr:hypothetical protein [Candidatus Bathyarchaeum sp.]